MAFLSKIQAVSADGSAKAIREIGVDIDHVLMASNGEVTLRTKLNELDGQIPTLATEDNAGLVKVSKGNGLLYNDNIISLQLANQTNPGALSMELFNTIQENIRIIGQLTEQVAKLETIINSFEDGEKVQF